MGTRVNQLKNGKFQFFHSFNDSKSSKFTREEALLYIRNTLSPYDFIKAYFCFPYGWTNEDYNIHPWNEEGNKKYRELLITLDDEEFWNKYLDIIKGLEDKVKEKSNVN